MFDHNMMDKVYPRIHMRADTASNSCHTYPTRRYLFLNHNEGFVIYLAGNWNDMHPTAHTAYPTSMRH
jgi:hypothetical protein